MYGDASETMQIQSFTSADRNRSLNSDLSKVCIHYFGQARQKDGSHHVYKTPWKGDPRINMQNHKGKAKAYQVKQVLLAIEKLEVEHATEK